MLSSPSQGPKVWWLKLNHSQVVTTLNEYLTRTKFARETRSCSQLLLSYVKPYGLVSRDTISRWIKLVLQSSGINVNIFKPHSTRSASTFKAELGVMLRQQIFLSRLDGSQNPLLLTSMTRRLGKTRLPMKVCKNVFTCMKLFTTSLCICLWSVMWSLCGW